MPVPTREITLLASQTITATGNGAASPESLRDNLPLSIQLKVGTVTGTTPNMVVKVQDSVDGGTTWFDLVTFTAVTASNASEVKRVLQPFGRLLRVVWTVTGTTPNFAAVEVKAG
jgi:hypothetical protein